MVFFQSLFVVFALFAVYSVARKKGEGLLSLRGMFFWVFFWVLAVAAVFYPNSTTIIANYFGIGRGTDLIVYVSLAIMFFVLFKFHIKLEKLNRNITKVVRQDSLEIVIKNKEK